MRGAVVAAALAAALGLAVAVDGQVVPDRGRDEAAASGREAPRRDGPLLRRADAPSLERVYAESRAARRPVRVPWTAYVGHLAKQIGTALARFLASAIEAVAGQGTLWVWVARILVGGALLVLLGLAGKLLAALARRRRGPAEEAPQALGAMPVSPSRDAVAWRAELERLLAAGEVAAALEAAWWWLARALLGERVDPSWTGRELLERAGRRDLLPLVRRFDVLAYGPRRPQPEEVRSYAARLAEVLV